MLNIRDDLFDPAWPDTVVAGRCVACGRSFFPAPSFCLDCGHSKIERRPAARHGRIYSWTVSHMPAAGFPAPYAVAYVDLADGLRIFAPLRGRIAESPEVGATVMLSVELFSNDAEVPVRGYCFRDEMDMS